MTFGSVCSGIEAASVAWLPLGWHCAFMSEIEPFPRAVLKHHYPDTPLHGDFTTIQRDDYEPIDVLVGGTPCQSFSVAGLRGGLADERGNLALEYLRLADRLRPRWLVWENVPGVLSSGGGRDFGAFLGGLGELGYGWAYRVLDAQYFGLAQRRKRVFVVGHLGDWAGPATVLAIAESLRWHPAPRREAGQGIANALTERPDRDGGNSEGQRLIANPLGAKRDGGTDTSFRGKSRSYIVRKPGLAGTHQSNKTQAVVTHALRAAAFGAGEDGTGRGTPLVAAFHQNQRAEVTVNDTTGALNSGSAVRRLTPVECARLQGFPDTYLDVTYRGKPAADGNKYRALGNSMAVPVMQWIGRRIEAAS